MNRRAGDYIVGKKLGQPDQEVYEGVHMETGEQVVIKFESRYPTLIHNETVTLQDLESMGTILL